MTEVRFDQRRNRVQVDGWSARVSVLDSDESGREDALRVSLHIRKGVNLVMEVVEGSGEVLVETWAGEPDRSGGLAVVTDQEGEPIGIALIPLDVLGERGSSNAGVQLYASMPAGVLPALVGLLGQLPDIVVVPQPGRTWLGDLQDLPEATRRTLVAP